MYSSTTTPTLRGENTTTTTTTTHTATHTTTTMPTTHKTTCQINPEVADQASHTLLQAFDKDPIATAAEEVMVAIGTPVLDVDPDNPYHITCHTDVAYMRIDADNLDEHCEEVTTRLQIRPVSNTFRVHSIGNTYAIIDTRNTNHYVQPWALCSRAADLSLRYDEETDIAPFAHRSTNRIYAPLPRVVEDYVADTLNRTVLDGRAVVGAITHGDEPDVLPFELSLDDYLAIQHDLDTFNDHLATLKASTPYNICWDHYGCSDGVTYIDTRYGIDTALTLPAELIAAASSTTTAKDFSRRLFGTRATKNVVRAVGRARSLGVLACAMALITQDTPSDWIAGIITAINTYNEQTIKEYNTQYDIAASMSAAMMMMQPYIAALDKPSYTRMLKPLATGAASFDEQLLACTSNNLSEDTNPEGTNPYVLDADNVFCAVTAAHPTSLHYNDVINNIDTTTLRTLGVYIRACGKAASDIQRSLNTGTDIYTHTHNTGAYNTARLTTSQFLRWVESPAGQDWKQAYADTERYIAENTNAYVYTQLVEELDDLHISDIGVRLRVARSTASYVSLGNALSNCIKNYTYRPTRRNVIGVYADRAPTKPVAALEVTPPFATNYESMITQLRAKANKTYRHENRIKSVVNGVTHTLRAQLYA